ncbi:unnamed protein product [Arctogadus glacialis]
MITSDAALYRGGLGVPLKKLTARVLAVRSIVCLSNINFRHHQLHNYRRSWCRGAMEPGRTVTGQCLGGGLQEGRDNLQCYSLCNPPTATNAELHSFPVQRVPDTAFS